MGVAAYQRARNSTENARATEHRLMGQVTGALIVARDQGFSGATVADVLHWNREVWNTLGSACADADNILPATVRAGIISLSLWVDRHSSGVMLGRADIDDLIVVNKMVMEGLGGN